MASSVNGSTGPQARLAEMAAELQDQLDAAKQARDEIVQTLKEHDQLVERLTVAVRALAGPTPRAKHSGAPNRKSAGPETLQLVEAAMAREDQALSVTDVAALVPTKHETAVRLAIYELRDAGRVRIAGVTGPRGAKAYALMPEVAAEHA